MTKEVCDVCGKNYPNHKFKVKKEMKYCDRMICLFKYMRIDICDSCYRKLINIKEALNENRD